MKAVVLFRGINVGGLILKMTPLKVMLEACGFEDIQTYIQSGNVVLTSHLEAPKDVEERIQEALKKELGLDVAVIVKAKDTYLRETVSHPFGEDVDEKDIYITFLKTSLKSDPSEFLESLKNEQEQFVLVHDLIFGCYGGGYGKSKYTTTFFEKKLGVVATTRNLATVKKLGMMLHEK